MWDYNRFVVPNLSSPSAPTANPADIIPAYPYVPPVDAFWLFGADKPAMLDELNGVALQRNINISKPGTFNGYTVAPNIVISGGGGAGATAVAVIDGTGALSRPVLTNPGVGYTSAPTATVVPNGAGTAGALTVSLGAAPTLGTGFATIPTATAVTALNGLITPIPDQVTQTQIAFVRPQGGGSIAQLIFGTATDDMTLGGDFLAYWINAFRTQAPPAAYTVLSPTGVTLNKFAMVALSQNNATGERRFSFSQGGPLQHLYTQGVTKVAATPARMTALGNAYYRSTSLYTGIDYAAYMVKAGILTTDDLTDIFQTTSSVIAQRGAAIAS